jgi:hypothetical protein
MFVVIISGNDRSKHTQESDALVQKQRFIDSGVSESDISIVEKDTFEPPEPS